MSEPRRALTFCVSQMDLVTEIFGGDSDLSDVQDEGAQTGVARRLKRSRGSDASVRPAKKIKRS